MSNPTQFIQKVGGPDVASEETIETSVIVEVDEVVKCHHHRHYCPLDNNDDNDDDGEGGGRG